MSELKSCPFCGKDVFKENDADICSVCAHVYDRSRDNTWWNTHPVEDFVYDNG